MAGPPQPPTCNIRNWRVFTNGYHKDSYYSPAEVQKIAANYRNLLAQVTPVMGLGHDRAKRLATSLGLPNVGMIKGADGIRATPAGDLYLTISNVPTWLGGMINAERYRAGSVELKPKLRDVNDPGKTHEGPILDAVALLGEEQPAVKGCDPPRATFDDGTEVPPNHDPMPVPSEVMTSLAKETFSADSTLCFSESFSMNPALEAKLAELGIPPDKIAEILALCGGQPEVEAAPVPPPPGTPATPSEAPADMNAMYTALSDKFADMEKRFGAMEAAKQEEAKGAEEKMAAMFSDAVAERCKKIAKKVEPAVIEKVIKPTALGILTAKTFSTDAERTKTFSDYFAPYEGLPDDPRLAAASIATGPDGKRHLSPLQESIVRKGGFLDRNAPRASANLRGVPSTN